ncbi:hypothetical protein OG596_26595 [Streptomyces sp. NBC_01102]|uniref:hypothetical protein n=1 Tax=Streptomyces sp. NBC_01102 TaxID=2903749 RepID=UPI0038671F23|nr:hypothetical protein OG596_26595 [Streptomyces sp. NBC_01102]
MSAASGVIFAAQKTHQTAAGIAASLEAAGLLQSPETATSPWERAVAGLNALVDADVAFHVEPDGHISAPFSDEHIEWDRKAKRWVLTHDGEDDEVAPPRDLRPGAEAARRTLRGRERLDASAAAEAEATHWKRLGMAPPAPVEDPHDSPRHHIYELGRDLPTGGAL